MLQESFILMAYRALRSRSALLPVRPTQLQIKSFSLHEWCSQNLISYLDWKDLNPQPVSMKTSRTIPVPCSDFSRIFRMLISMRAKSLSSMSSSASDSNLYWRFFWSCKAVVAFRKVDRWPIRFEKSTGDPYISTGNHLTHLNYSTWCVQQIDYSRLCYVFASSTVPKILQKHRVWWRSILCYAKWFRLLSIVFWKSWRKQLPVAIATQCMLHC